MLRAEPVWRDGPKGRSSLTQVLGRSPPLSTGSLDKGRSQGQQSEQRRQRAQRCDWQVSLVHQAQMVAEGSAQIEQTKRMAVFTYGPLPVPRRALGEPAGAV